MKVILKNYQKFQKKYSFFFLNRSYTIFSDVEDIDAKWIAAIEASLMRSPELWRRLKISMKIYGPFEV